MGWQRSAFLIQGVLLGGLILFPTGVFAKDVKEKSSTLYRGRDYRDPTLNPLLSKPAQESKAVTEVVRLPSLTVQGVMWGTDSPRAIINKQVVVKGDVLPEGIEVLDISKAGIKVLYREKIFTLLPKGAIEEK